MDSILNRVAKDSGRRNRSSPSTSGDIFDPSSSSNGEAEGSINSNTMYLLNKLLLGRIFTLTIHCYVCS